MTDLKTGEGFAGERALEIAGLFLTVISTCLLIHLTMLQRKHIKTELAKQEEQEEAKKKKDLENNKVQIKN